MNEKHIMIDRDQYELQTAELCDLRARFARLYDETPIDGAWLDECNVSSVSCYAWNAGDPCWTAYDPDKARTIYVRTRGEFRRAAELLGIQLNEKGGE